MRSFRTIKVIKKFKISTYDYKKNYSFKNCRLPSSRSRYWAERALMDEDFDEADIEVLSRVISRVGLADVPEFELTWNDCEELLHQLGFEARVDVVPA